MSWRLSSSSDPEALAVVDGLVTFSVAASTSLTTIADPVTDVTVESDRHAAFPLGLDQAARGVAWTRAVEAARERGFDPDELIARARRNLASARTGTDWPLPEKLFEDDDE